MIGDAAIEPQATKPPIREIKMDLLAQPTLRTNAQAVADDEHPDHQLGINRGPPHVAIVGTQMRPNLGQVDEPIDLAKQVTVRDMPLKAEAVEQRLLHHPPFAHHRPNLLHPEEENQRPAPRSSRVYGMARPSFRRRRLAGESGGGRDGYLCAWHRPRQERLQRGWA